MKKSSPSLDRAGPSRSEAGSALVIVLAFVVLLTVVVLAMLSRSLINGLISNASSNVSKTDLYGHGMIDQIIGDLRQEIVAGSSGTSGGQANTQAVYTSSGGIVTYAYRPAAVANSVPSLSGPSSYTTSIWNTTFPNLVKESTRSVAFEPYDTTVPMRAAPVNSNSDLSINGRYVSPARWNKPLLLPKKSASFGGGTGGTATTVTDTGTITTPVSTFVAPDWILTAADGSNPTTWPASPAATIANSKSTSYVVGRYAYTIYNEGGLLDANVAGSPGSSTVSGGLTAAEVTTLSRKGPSAFADLTQLPGIADLATAEGSALRPQKIIDTLVGWRNAATTQAAYSTYPNYAFTSTTAGNYLNYVLGQSNNFLSTGNTSVYADPNTGQNLTDQAFSSRQQMISFFQSIIPKNSTEQAYLQDAMMYLGTFSRTLNQPSYWPDPTRPRVLAASNTTGASTYGNSAYQADDTANPAFKSIRAATAFTRNDGTAAAIGEPLVKKRFALSRLAWLTCDGPIADDNGNLNTSDTNINAIVTYLEGTSVGMTASFLGEGGPTNIHKYFGLTWVAGPSGQGSPGGYWYYDHGSQLGGGTVLGTLSQVATANREPDFFELLLAGINVGGIAKVMGTIGSSTFTDIQDSTVSVQILQLGANIIDEANPTQYPTHIVYPFSSSSGTTVYKSAFGVMDLPCLASVSDVRFIVQASSIATGSNTPMGTTAAVAATAPASPTATSGIYPNASGTGVLIYVPSIWNPCDVNGPMPITTSGKTAAAGAAASTLVAPTNLRIVLSSVITDLNTTLGPPSNGSATTGNQNSTWPGPASSEWTSVNGLGTYPVQIIPSDIWSTSVANAPSATNSFTVITGTITTTGTFFSLCQGSYSSNWTSESSTALTFSNVSSLYREPTALMQKNVPANSNLAMGAGNAITTLNSAWTSGIPEASSGMNFVGWLASTFPLVWTLPATGSSPPSPDYIYSVNNLPESVTSANSQSFSSTLPASGETVRLEYQVGSNWIPYMEYSGAGGSNGNGHVLQYSHDFMPLVETKVTGTSGANPATTGPSELLPMGGSSGSTSTGSLWNNNLNGSPGGFTPGRMALWDVRTSTWGFPTDVGSPPLFLDSISATGPTTEMTETLMPSATTSKAATTHSLGTNMVAWGVYEPNGGVIFGTKQQNYFGNGSTTTPNTDYYMDPDGTVRRAIGAYVGPNSGATGNTNGTVSWTWTASTAMGLPMAATVSYPTSTSTSYSAPSTQAQSRPIILHRPYRSVAELGYVFSNTPYKNIDFSTPESPYSALLDIFCINEDYRPDAVAAGRVDLNTKQAPVLQALLAGAYRDEDPSNSLTPAYTQVAALTQSEAIAISQALVTRTTGTASGKGPLSNVGDLVGRWISGTTVGTTTTPINGAVSYDGFSADLGIPPYAVTYSNIIQRFRSSTIRALSDAGQAGTWNLLIDVVAQSGHYPVNATGLSNFLVEGEHRYWVHVAIDRSTGQVIDENIEPVNE